MLEKIFKWIVTQTGYYFITTTTNRTYSAFRAMEICLDNNRTIKFSIAKDARKKPVWQRLCLIETFLVFAEINTNFSSALLVAGKNKLVVMNVPLGRLFSDEMIGEVLLDIYLDKLIDDLSD